MLLVDQLQIEGSGNCKCLKYETIWVIPQLRGPQLSGWRDDIVFSISYLEANK